MKLKRHRFISSLKAKWTDIDRERKNSQKPFSIYQTYEINELTVKNFLPIAFKKGYYPIWFEITDDNGKTLLIAPLCKSIFKDEYTLFGDFIGFQYCDFIYYPTEKLDNLSSSIIFLLSKLRINKLCINKILESSCLFEFLKSCNIDNYVKDIEFRTCINIELNDNYENYFRRLTKSVRQNIRTAYIRLNRENLNIEFSVFDRENYLSDKQYKNIIDFYCDRRSERYGKLSFLKRLYLKYFSFSTKILKYHKNRIACVLKIDNQLAAFFCGLKSGNTIVIPRLSISSKFKVFCPGILLLNEAAKFYTESSEILNLDLSIGAEPYKVSAGGSPYNIMNVVFNAKNSSR